MKTSRAVYIHFIGWNHKFDHWVPKHCGRMALRNTHSKYPYRRFGWDFKIWPLYVCSLQYKRFFYFSKRPQGPAIEMSRKQRQSFTKTNGIRRSKRMWFTTFYTVRSVFWVQLITSTMWAFPIFLINKKIKNFSNLKFQPSALDIQLVDHEWASFSLPDSGDNRKVTNFEFQIIGYLTGDGKRFFVFTFKNSARCIWDPNLWRDF